MKNKIKKSFYIISCCIFLFCICIYFYIQSIKSHLKELESDVSNKWTEYFLFSTERVTVTGEFINCRDCNIPNQTEIQLAVKNNLIERNKYKKECNLNYIELEFHLNKRLMNLLDSSNLDTAKYKTFKTSFVFSNNKLNDLVYVYNNSVMNYNMFRSMFPNFLIAKKDGYKRKKQFTIQYGINNEDPIIKNKELPKWAAGVDTTL